MHKIIEIYITNEDDLYERYNKKNISKDLITYIIDSAQYIKKNDTIKIIINNKLKNNNKCIPLIIDGLKQEYDNSIFINHRNNIIELLFLITGLLTLFISTLIIKEIIKEIVLIGGWVLIWSMIELEIFSDTSERRKRKILKKILNSEMIEM